MINATFRFVDYMSGIPMGNVDVTVHVVVQPEWMVTAGGSHINVPSLPGSPWSALSPEQLHRQIGGKTTSDGVFSVSIDASASFALISKALDEAKRKPGVTAALYAEFRSPCLEFDPAFPAFGHPGIYDVGEDASPSRTTTVDHAKSIVGHTSPNSATLWFHLHGQLKPGVSCVCEIERVLNGISTIQSFPVPFTAAAGQPNIAVLNVPGLETHTTYRYSAWLRSGSTTAPGQAGTLIAEGSFTTAPVASNSLQFVFGSCHEPLPPHKDHGKDVDPLERYRELGKRRDYELLLLIGDQMYGDGLDKDQGSWFERYVKRYHQFWIDRAMREVMQRTPTYMILDDHEVNDDWGCVEQFPEDKDKVDHENRVQGALQAYRMFQQSHNPGGKDGPIHYNFRWGPASFFVVDNRSKRSWNQTDVEYPILGPAQYKDLQDWANSKETRSSDIIVFVSPVPIAFLPVGELEKVIASLRQTPSQWGLIAGIIVAGVVAGFGGPASLVVLVGLGAGLGTYGVTKQITDEKLEAAGLSDLTGKDLADMWTNPPNQKELGRVLDCLFELANDLPPGGGTPGKHRRAVFILGGDVHSGSMHMIRSVKPKNKHQSNPLIYHLTSSAISQVPANDTIYEKVVAHVKEGKSVNFIDLLNAKFNFDNVADDTFGQSNALFSLDGTMGKNYYAEFINLLARERNFGHVRVDRIRQDRRVYRFSTAIEGTSTTIRRTFELDLDADPVVHTELPWGWAKGFREALKRYPDIGLPVSMRHLHSRFGVVPPLTARSLLTKMAPK